MPRTRSQVRDVDRGWQALLKRVHDVAHLKSARVKVGVLADDSKGGMREKGGKLTLAEIFAVLNFGTRDGKIPPRPVLTETFDAQRGHLKDLGAELIAGVIVGNVDLETALNIMGADLATAVKSAITAGFPPPNTPSTALAKAGKGRTRGLFGRTPGNVGQALAQVGALSAVKPLIDTGRLLGAITWAIVGKGEQR